MLFLILLTMLSPATFGMAQTIIVKDSITHEAVPFVSVNFGNDTGGYTDENGAIAIPNEAAQIRLSHICYETKSISKITADLQTIFLVPKSINLDEVAISAKALKKRRRRPSTKEPMDLRWLCSFHMIALGLRRHISTLFWQVSIIPPIGWYSRKSRHPSMPLSALTSVCQMPRLVPQKTNLSLMVALYSLPVRNSAKMA